MNRKQILSLFTIFILFFILVHIFIDDRIKTDHKKTDSSKNDFDAIFPSKASILPIQNKDLSGLSLQETYNLIAKRSIPAVVSLHVTLKNRSSHQPNYFDHPFFREFFPPELRRKQKKAQTGGSGFIISEDGYLISNSHVVENAEIIEVIFENRKKKYTAKVIGADPQTDVALLKINEKGPFPFLRMANSDEVEVGDIVVAIGNPFGFSHTLTTGVVSAKGRDEISEVNPLMNYIQTDVAINPGNSGGPLISISGEVIGVNTMIYSRSGGSIGIGFSIPINMAKNIAKQLKSKGRIERGWLGVEVNEFDEELRKTLGFKGDGLYVVRVFKDSPADKSGLEAGDIILKLGEKIVDTLKTLKLLVNSSPGKNFDLKVKRGRKEITLKVKIGEDTSQIRLTSNGSEISFLGITVIDMDDNLMNKYRASRPFGVVISKIESDGAFEGTGIREGDIIRMVESTPTPTLNVFNQIIQENSKNKEILFHIYRNGRLTPVRIYP